MPVSADLIIHPRWTLLTDPIVEAREGLAIAVKDGQIVAIDAFDNLCSQYDADVIHTRPNHVLMPGLVNAHCHAAMTLLRGFADDLSLENWLQDHIWPAESKWVNRDFIADGTQLAIAEMLLGGTTCFADMYYYPDVVADVAEAAGIRCNVGLIALEAPTVWAATADEYISKGLTVHDSTRASSLITTAFAPHAPYSVADATLSRIKQLADELDLPVHMHIHETAAEVTGAVNQTGQRPLERLRDLGLVNPALMAVHATTLSESEIELLSTHNSSVVHCPRSNMKLASGACPVAKLIDANVNVALGTDGAASNNRLDMWSELQFAALMGKQIAGDATAVSASDALQMATINGARALGLGDVTGSVTIGKAADVICVDLNGPELQPVLDPISQLVYSASREHVSDVWIAGEHLVDTSGLMRMPLDDLRAAIETWRQRIQTTAVN